MTASRSLASLLLAALLGSSGAARSDEPQARLRGRVFERGSISAIGGVELHLGSGATHVADAAGRFDIAVPPGDVDLVLTESQHEPLRARERLAPGQVKDVTYRMLLLPSWKRKRYETTVRGPETVHAGAKVSLRDEELRQMPGTLGDPFRVVGLLPGVATPVPLLPAYVVRGATPGMNGFFLDGMRVPQLFHFMAGGGVVHARLLDRLDFYPGTYDASFGHYSGGIIDSETRAARDRPHGELELRLYDASAIVEGKLPGDVRIIAAGHYGYPGPLLGLVVSNLGLQFWDYQLRLDWRGLTVMAIGSFDALQMSSAGATPGTTATSELRLAFHRVQARYRARKGRLDVEAGIVGGYDEMAALAGQGVEKLALNARLNSRLRLGWLTLAGGLEGEISRYTPVQFSTGIARSSPDMLGVLGVARDGQTGSLWLQAEVNLLRRVLNVTVGARVDVYHADKVTLIGIDPRATLRLQIHDRVAILGGLGQYQQPPAFPVALPGIDTYALELGLQRAWQGSLGVEAKLPASFTLSASGYYQMFHDINDVLLDFRPTSCSSPAPESLTGVPALITRKVDGLAYGAEILLRRTEGRVTGWLAYTVGRSVRQYSCGTAPADFDQTHVLNLVVQARLPWNLMLSGRLAVSTGRPYTQIPSDFQLGDVPPRNNQRMPTYVQLDLRLDREWIFQRWALSLFLDVLNATYSESVVAVTYPTTAGITRYDQPQLNGTRWILPSIGLRGRF